MSSVLLIFPKHSPFPHSIAYPATIYSLGKYLEKFGYEVNYFDERIDGRQKLLNYIINKPLLVGVSAKTSYQITSALRLAKHIRNRDNKLPIVWGGLHPTMLPEETMKNQYVDYVVKGEGEETLKELADYFSGTKDIEAINGLLWKKNGQIITNKEREYLDYNEVPSPYYSVSNQTIQKYLNKDEQIVARQPLFYFTSRGCRYACTFCYNAYFNKNTWRPRSFTLIKEELLELKNRGISKIYFGDDNIASTNEHLEGICDVMEEIGMTWSASIRVPNVTDAIAKKLERSNCQYLFFGIESGCEIMLNYMKKGINVTQIERCVKAVAKTNIIPLYSFVFGFPYETKEHVPKSYDMVDWIREKHPKANIQFQIYTPFPGTPMYKEAIEKGFQPPSSLEKWAKFVCDDVHVPWVKNKKILRNMFVISIFAFRSDQFLKNIIFYIPHKLALMRWKYKFFKFSYERLFYDLIKTKSWLD